MTTSRNVFLTIAMLALLVVAACASTQIPASTAPTPTTPAGADAAPPTQAGATKDVHIDMYNYGFTQDPVTINKGDHVRLRVTSSSGTHGIALPDFGVSTGPLGPGQEQVLEFTADKSGSFSYYCNVPCGPGHRSMRAELVVV